MTTIRPPNWLVSAGFAAIFATTGAISALGSGFDLPDQDAFVVGRGMAFVATADNPSAIYYNPAGITQLAGQNARAGLYNIYLAPNYTPPNSSQNFENQDRYHSVPQLFYTYGRENCPVSFGLGIYSPFGLGLRWPQDSGLRTAGIRSKVTDIAINPVLALKLSDRFSIGGGVIANYSDIQLRQGLTPTPDLGQFQFDGSGWDVGYSLGALWQVQEKVFIGASFRSEMNPDLHGHTEVSGGVPGSGSTSASGNFPLPLKAIFGVSYRPTPKWNLEFNADYTDWNSEGTVLIYQSAPLLGTPVIPVTLNWQSSWYYEFGATRYFDNRWHVSAGYILNENSVPSANATPLVADMNKHFFSVGIGRRGERFDFDVAYQFGYGTRTVSDALQPAANGSYEFFSHALAASVEMHF